MQFQYYLPVNLIFGRGVASQIGEQVAQYGGKALVVTGRHSTKKSGLLDRALCLLKKAGVQAVVFDQVAQNPLTTTVEEGTALAKQESCNVVVGLGGGSIMDAAKAIAFMACNGGDVNDYIFERKHSQKALPLVLVPTTCGTGSEGNGFAVLTNPETKDKKSLRGPMIVAKASLIDPELMTTMPKSVFASVGFDALSHNMEAYISKAAQPMTDMMAREGMHLIAENLPKLYHDPSDMEAWEKMTWGSTLGGMVINTAGVSGAHGMENPASGLRDIVHGRGLAALTPALYRRSISAAPERFAEISRILGGKDEHDCIDRIEALLDSIDLHITLGEQGILPEDVPWMVEDCLKVSAGSMRNHPAAFTKEELAEIYREAL